MPICQGECYTCYKETREDMSKKKREALMKLRESIQVNAPRIEKKLSRSGAKPEPAVVYSTAKYYKTLSRLAKE